MEGVLSYTRYACGAGAGRIRNCVDTSLNQNLLACDYDSRLGEYKVSFELSTRMFSWVLL